MDTLATFQSHRRLLFSVAYRMLGSASEAEDVLQDAYLRYSTAAPDEVRAPKAYLTSIVTHLCLDRLKSAHARRETYPGVWLPEPVLDTTVSPDTQAVDPERRAVQHESITMAFLVLLETLTPQERAVFLLREVFEYEYGEIAATLGLSEAYCRQLFHRARQHVLEHRPRFQAEPEKQQELVMSFLNAAQSGELDQLTSLLGQEVVFTADGGGKASAALHPVHGSLPVAKVMAGIFTAGARQLRQQGATFSATLAWINGEPGVLIWTHWPSEPARLEIVFVFSFDGERIARIWAHRNPDKLAGLARQSTPPAVS